MLRCCEICASIERRAGEVSGRLRRVLFEGRLLTLCEPHASAARESGVDTLAELRARFVEAGGQRSLLTRRAPLDRRLFPPRPEGRRRGAGRRASDVDP
jgi:hypothetical protein